MAARKRTPTQVQADRTRILYLHLQGLTEAEIGQRLGVGQTQVAYDLKRVRGEWDARHEGERDRLIGEELSRIRLMEREGWQEWQASKQERETHLSEMTSGGSAGEARQRAAVKVERKGANPSYMAIVQWAVERRCRLLGLDAPATLKFDNSLVGLLREVSDELEEGTESGAGASPS